MLQVMIMKQKKVIYILLAGMMLSSSIVLGGCSIHNEQNKAPQTVKETKTKTNVDQNTNFEVPMKSEKQDNKVIMNMELDVQENNFYCGPAVVKTILQYFGIDRTQGQLAEAMHTSSITGTEYADIAQVLNQEVFHRENPGYQENGYHVHTLPIQNNSPDEKKNWQLRMRKNIDDGYPSILAVDMHTLYPQMKRANHFVICVGYLADQENEITYFYILDPFYGVQDETYGGLKYFSPTELWSAIAENEEPAYIY